MIIIENGAMNMSVKMLTFNSREEWLKNRTNGIGGSDISAVIGCNPYKSNHDLWLEKTGQITPADISDKDFVRYGHNAEPLLRELFKLDYPEMKVEYIDNNCFINSKYPWALASLDGWITDADGRKGILEIKTTEVLQSIQKEKWNKQIPQNYYCQVLFYMAVLEADFCILKAQLKTVFEGVPYLQTKHYKIERADVQADIDYLMQEGERFWRYVLNKKEPPLKLPEF